MGYVGIKSHYLHCNYNSIVSYGAKIFGFVYKTNIESAIYDQPFWMICFKWWSINSEHFSVGPPQLEITSLHRTLWNLLWILGEWYSLSNWLAFLNSCVNYLICFSIKKPLLWRLINILLLASDNLLRIFSVLITSLQPLVSLDCFSDSNKESFLDILEYFKSENGISKKMFSTWLQKPSR